MTNIRKVAAEATSVLASSAVQAVAKACVRHCHQEHITSSKQRNEIACAYFMGALAAMGDNGDPEEAALISRATSMVLSPAPYSVVLGFLDGSSAGLPLAA